MRGGEGLWGSMGGGGVSNEKEVGGGASTTTAPPPPPRQAATQPNPTPLKKTFKRAVRLRVRLGERRRGDPP